MITLAHSPKCKSTRSEAAESLGKIGQGNKDAIAALITLIQTDEDWYTRSEAAKSLGKIGQGNKDVIAALITLIQTDEDEFTRSNAAKSLGEIINTDEQRQSVVSTLQPHLNNQTYENNSSLFYRCYESLWDIAQSLPYPNFYRTWHGLTET